MRVLAQPRSASSAERVWSAYGCVPKDQAKKLVKVYFNGRALEKAREVEWESQAFFMWDESEPLADSESDEYFFETPDLTPVLIVTG